MPEHNSQRREVDATTAKSGLRATLESLTPAELVLGKVDEQGEIVWSGCPRWFRNHPRTMPTVDGIIDDIFGSDAADQTGAGT